MTKTKKRVVIKRKFPVWGWILISIILVGIIGILLSQSIQPAMTTLQTEVSVAQAAKLRDEGAFILDVREQSEWEQFHISGATLIPLGELPNRLNEVPKDQTAVVVCRTGHRSAQGRDILLNAGFTQVASMTGGVTEWQAQGLETVTGP
jgi:rhodanese-related sulfurtransferase